MKKLNLAIIFCAIFASSSFGAYGILIGEKISGTNKICYYNVLGSTYTLNVDLTDLCPVSYDF